MITTITMNPSVDIQYRLEELKIDQVNRVTRHNKTAGGKGINVVRVLNLLDIEATATGILGGTTGKYITNHLNQDGISNDFLKISKESRNCIAVIHDGGKQTEILEPGPVITKEESSTFLEHLRSLLDKTSLITVSGSLPKGLAKDFYTQIIADCHKKNIKVILDTSNESLLSVLQSPYKPFAIKPNEEELRALFPKVSPKDNLRNILENPLFEGVDIVCVTRGKEGALIKWSSNYYNVTIPTIKVINPVGSGDATVAGLASSIYEDKSVEECIKTAMTTGILNAMHERTGYIDKSRFQEIYSKIEVEQL